MRAKCQNCKTNEASWAWQPFGPDEDPHSAAALGHHYRGFPVVKLCDFCFDLMQDNDSEQGFTFTRGGKHFLLRAGKVTELGGAA